MYIIFIKEAIQKMFYVLTDIYSRVCTATRCNQNKNDVNNTPNLITIYLLLNVNNYLTQFSMRWGAIKNNKIDAYNNTNSILLVKNDLQAIIIAKYGTYTLKQSDISSHLYLAYTSWGSKHLILLLFMKHGPLNFYMLVFNILHVTLSTSNNILYQILSICSHNSDSKQAKIYVLTRI